MIQVTQSPYVAIPGGLIGTQFPFDAFPGGLIESQTLIKAIASPKINGAVAFDSQIFQGYYEVSRDSRVGIQE